MTFMAEHSIIDAANEIDADKYPNLARVAHTVRNLMRWTNNNSDGWAYWEKPGRAARKATEALVGYRQAWIRDEVVDLTDAEYRKVLAPIKAFMTRYNREHSEGQHSYSDRIEPERILI